MSPGWLYGRVLHPAYHALKRDGVGPAMRELARSQWADPAAIEALQGRKLALLLRFAGVHVPYYARQFRERGKRPDYFADTGRLAELPILSKALIREAGSSLHADPAAGRRAYPNSTSGSTGEPMRFLTDLGSHALRIADEGRGKSWTGFRLGQPEIALWGAPMDVNRAQRQRGRLHSRISGHRLLSSFDLTPARMDEYIATLRRVAPRLLVAYPSALEVFARHCLERSARLRRLAGLITSAETLSEQQRALFERVFASPVFNRYGCREVGAIAHECAAHDGLHVSADRLLLEIVDEAGRPCGPGEWGELLITDLANYAMPLIRYRIGDRAAWAAPSQCACGRHLPRLMGIEGRSMDAISGPNGRSVGGTFWTLLLRSRPGIRQFQVQQDSDGTVTVRYVPEPAVDTRAFAQYTQKIRERLGEGLVVRYDAVDAIPPASSGKQRLVSSAYRPAARVGE